MKWSQPPDYLGLDLISNHPSEITRADDFICNDPAPIVAVRWWGSYIGETTPRDEQSGFWKSMDISFHLSDGNDHPLSLPVNPYLSLQTVLAQETFWGEDAQGELVYEYNASLPQPFYQELGVEYFIDIDDPLEGNWGWHTAESQNLDYSASQSPNHIGPWAHDPDAYVDLAFELMVPEPATIALLGLGALSLIRSRKRKT
ncbi:MAG: PEP-CTERM sorting domain-containing protein [Dehalococcoidia bacterium]|nr:PEP-CTERM sorting domain-containing protein [Dehalococcoidia bacterium]